LSADHTNATTGTIGVLTYVQPISAYTPAWVRWPGHWGNSTGDFTGQGGNSPRGPAADPGAHPSWGDPAGWDANARTDLCPDPWTIEGAPMGKMLTKGQHATWTHSTAGDGDGPIISWRHVKGHAVRVTWRQPDDLGGRTPLTVQVSAHTTERVFPAVTRRFEAKAHGRTSAKLGLPKAAGPYEIVVKTLWKDGTLSAETTAQVEG
jgi:hypothetical protein